MSGRVRELGQTGPGYVVAYIDDYFGHGPVNSGQTFAVYCKEWSSTRQSQYDPPSGR